MEPFFYTAFGLIFRSAFPIHALEPRRLDGAGRWDVDIRLCDVPAPANGVPLREMRVEISDRDGVFEIPESGTFRIRDGATIDVLPWPGATADEVEAYLLGTCMGTLLYQRRLFPLHANAVVCDGMAFAVCGDSGAGKSTLAAFFARAGLPLLTDDLLAVAAGESGVLVHSGIPRVKLWQDAIEALGHSAEGLRPVSWMEGKFESPLNQLASGVFPLRAIYNLGLAGDGETTVERLQGLSAMTVVLQNIYRRELADMAGQSKTYFEAATRLGQQVPVFSFRRPAGFDHFEASSAVLVSHMKSLASAR